jgi:hypothetical protein
MLSAITAVSGQSIRIDSLGLFITAGLDDIGRPYVSVGRLAGYAEGLEAALKLLES